MKSYESFSLMLKEGLIMTHELLKCSKIIDKIVGDLGIWQKINYDFNKNVFNIEFEEIINENQFDYLDYELTKLGYYPSYYRVYNKLGGSKNFPWSDIKKYISDTKNKKSVDIFFESKFDQKLKYKPKFLYHCTNTNNITKIKKQGLMPSYTEKGDFRPDRIYFSLSYKDSLEISKKLKFKDIIDGNNFEYNILKINTELVKEKQELILYQDPRSKGVYTYNHINPKYIEII